MCSQPRQPCKKIVVKKERILHPERPRAKKVMTVLKNGKKKRVWVPDFGGWGDQIVAEAKVCLSCASHWEWSHPIVKKEIDN